MEAACTAGMATKGGDWALLVFGPGRFAPGQSGAMASAHFKRIANASDLPIIVFQYPLAGGQGYPLETLLRLIDDGPTIRAIKDWCNSVPLHERHIRAPQGRPRPINVLPTHSTWPLRSL